MTASWAIARLATLAVVLQLFGGSACASGGSAPTVDDRPAGRDSPLDDPFQWLRLQRFPGGEASRLLGRRLTVETSQELGNGTAVSAEEGDAVINAVIGTLTAMGGTRIQPVILLINGFIAAEVGKAFNDMLDDFDPDTIVAFFLRCLSGFSVGTVGIQNMQFQSVLQGGVLFASLLASGRSEVEKWIQDTFDFGQEWLLMAVDVLCTSLGSLLAVAFMALFKVLNSSYLSATMFVNGWVVVIESGYGVDIPAWVETAVTVMVLVFCLWWHSLIISGARAEKWKKLTASPPRTQFQSPIKRVTAVLVLPVSIVNKMVTAFSQSLGRAFNLKAKPMTTKQIVDYVLTELNLSSVGMIIAKQVAIRKCKMYVADVMKERGVEGDGLKKARNVTGMVCGALDVSTMKMLLFELRSGSGNIQQVLDGCFEDVLRAIQRQQLLKPVEDGEAETTDPRRLKPEQLAEVWDQCSSAIMEGTARAVRHQLKAVLPRYCGLQEKSQKEYVASLTDQLQLSEMIVILRMVRSSRFQLPDLMDLLEQKARDAKGRASRASHHKVKESAAPAESAEAVADLAQAKGSDEGAERGAEAGGAELGATGNAGLVQAGSAMASAAIKKSHETSVNKLAEAFTDILDLNQFAARLPLPARALLKMVMAPVSRVRHIVESAMVVVPVLGPQVVKLFDMVESMLKAKVLSMVIGKMIRRAGIPMERISKVVQAMASQDEYLVDMLTDLLTSAAQTGNAAGVAAAGSAKGHGLKEAGGSTGIIIELVEELGPGRCREMLLYCMVEFLEIDFAVAEKFVKQLGIKPLMKLGQDIMRSGFNFDECTEQARNKVEEFVFEVPLEDIENGIAEAQLAINFASPPLVVTVDADWAAEAAGDTDSHVPQKGDKLAAIGHKPAANMTKEEFELEVQARVDAQKRAAAEEDGKSPTLRLKFRRGLDIDFAERFRERVPSVLRRFVGVPLPDGKEFARNLTTVEMQELMSILLKGNRGLKKLDDLATNLGVELDFENAFRAQLPMLLVRKFGFRYQGASTFAASLDPSTSSVLTRFSQMIGCGELDAMFAIVATENVMALDHLHMHRFKPRAELNKLLPTNPLLEPDGTTVNLVVSQQGQFELWKNGEVLGRVHEDTIVMVVNVWREYLTIHIDEDQGPIEGILPFESEASVDKLKEEHVDIHAMKAQKKLFKWPDNVSENASLSPNDTEAAQQLFFQALEDVRESVWAKYQRKISLAAQKALGATEKDVKSADAHEAEVAEALQEDREGDDAHKEVYQWMEQVFDSLPAASNEAKMFRSASELKAGAERARQLRKLEIAVEGRDLFRLQKIAGRYGVTTPVPAEGLMKQLRANLSMLPPGVDVVANADKLAAFVAASQHPLTGPRAAGPPPVVTAGEAKAGSSSDQHVQETAGDRTLEPEAVHGAAPPEARLATAPALKMKELFNLAQKGGFETLSKFVAPSVPGGTDAVAKEMRGALIAQLQQSFPQVSQEQAQEAAEFLIPTSHSVLAATKIATEDGTPTLLDGSPSIPEPEERDGPQLAKKTRVAVAEQKNDLARIARPVRGWVRASELQALNSAGGGGDTTAVVSSALRGLKTYDLRILAELSDDLSWGLDFPSLAQQRVIQAVLQKTQSYQATVLKKAARSAGEDTLRGCLLALDRKDLSYVIDALALPPAQKAKAPENSAQPRKKTKEEKELERQVRALQQQVQELEQQRAGDAAQAQQANEQLQKASKSSAGELISTHKDDHVVGESIGGHQLDPGAAGTVEIETFPDAAGQAQHNGWLKGCAPCVS